MLTDRHIHPTLPVADLARARRFYEETLGYAPQLVSPEGIQYPSGGSWFLIYPTPSAGTAQNTAMGFSVTDIEAEVADLRSRGVDFLEYDYPGFATVNGIATTPAGRAAWFKDTEGNILGLFQDAQAS